MQADPILEILALLADYGQTVDEQRWDAHRALWSTDSHLIVFEKDYAGGDKITRFMKRSPRGKHLTGVPNLQIDGDRARARSDYVFFSEQLAPQSAGSYVDEFIREDGRWRIARRQIEIRLQATG